MKLLIDIPEEDYIFIKKQVVNNITNPLKVRIANGKPCEEKTHGKWIHGTRLDGSKYFRCSECDELAGCDYEGNHEESDYCPNCGAKMDEKEAEQ